MIFALLQRLIAVHLLFFWPAEVVRSHFGFPALQYGCPLSCPNLLMIKLIKKLPSFTDEGSSFIHLPKVKTVAGNRISKDETVSCKTHHTLICNTESKMVCQDFSFFDLPFKTQ